MSFLCFQSLKAEERVGGANDQSPIGDGGRSQDALPQFNFVNRFCIITLIFHDQPFTGLVKNVETVF